MKRPRVLAALMLAATSAACVPSDYLVADRLTYEAVAPEYARYVRRDPDLTEAQRERRLRTLESWRLRLEAAEGRR